MSSRHNESVGMEEEKLFAEDHQTATDLGALS